MCWNLTFQDPNRWRNLFLAALRKKKGALIQDLVSMFLGRGWTNPVEKNVSQIGLFFQVWVNIFFFLQPPPSFCVWWHDLFKWESWQMLEGMCNHTKKCGYFFCPHPPLPRFYWSPERFYFHFKCPKKTRKKIFTLSPLRFWRQDTSRLLVIHPVNIQLPGTHRMFLQLYLIPWNISWVQAGCRKNSKTLQYSWIKRGRYYNSSCKPFFFVA